MYVDCFIIFFFFFCFDLIYRAVSLRVGKIFKSILDYANNKHVCLSSQYAINPWVRHSLVPDKLQVNKC